MSIQSLGRGGLALLLAGAAFPVAGALAAPPALGPYVSLGAGVDLPQFESLSAVPGLAAKRSVHLDAGVAAQTAVGYGLGNGLRVEVEGNYLNDHIRKVEVPGGVPRRSGGYEQQYGGFVNALYDIPLRLPFTPYVGVGAGGQVLELDGFNSSRLGYRLPNSLGSARLGSFAYQAIAGVSAPLPFVRGLSLTVEYRLIGLPDPLPGLSTNFLNGNGQLVARDHERFGNVFHHSVLLGIRYAFNTAPPPPPPPAPVVPAAPPAEARTYLVFFDWDRSDLTPRAREIVAQAAQASTHVQTTRIEVDGYTDNSSIHGGARGARYNIGLSIRRAQSVKAELIRDGVPGSAIDTHGFGESHPLVPTGPDTREPQNRRVEIVLH